MSAIDYVGHGAIRFYYRISESVGDNEECSDFTTPDNFPAEIAKAIEEGKFKGLAAPRKLLSEAALAECEKVAWAAWAEYEKVARAIFWDLFANPKNRNPKWR